MTLHCPECKSTKISPVVETTNNGGYAVNTSVTRRSSVSNITLNSTHRNYWMCSNCGNKFRNIQNLQAEIVSESKKLKMYLFALVLVVFIAVVSLVMDWIAFFGPVVLILGALCAYYWLSTKKRITSMTQELAYLKRKCFD